MGYPTHPLQLPSPFPMKAAVLPIFRSQWLWHAWSGESAQVLVKAPHWRTGRNLEERIQLLSETLKVKASCRMCNVSSSPANVSKARSLDAVGCKWV